VSTEFKQSLRNLVADLSELIEDGEICGEHLRVGIDVVSISEFERLIGTRAGAALVRSRFTQSELTYCEDRSERLAGRWASKEAVSKAIGTGFRGIRPLDIEICHEDWGQPKVNCSTSHSWPNGAHAWSWSISITHEGDAAVAIAIAVIPKTQLSK